MLNVDNYTTVAVMIGIEDKQKKSNINAYDGLNCFRTDVILLSKNDHAATNEGQPDTARTAPAATGRDCDALDGFAELNTKEVG